MKSHILITLLILSFFSLQSCSTLKKGFSSEKKNSVDEFLVEKKSPLVMPPEFGELPVPGGSQNENIDDNDIRSLLSSDSKNTTLKTKTNQKQSTLEGLIMEKIKN